MKIVNVSKLYGLCGPRGGAKSYFAIVNEEGALTAKPLIFLAVVDTH